MAIATQTIEAKTTRILPVAPAGAKPPTDSVIFALRAEDQVLLTKLLTEPADYVYHPDFECPATEAKLYGQRAKLVHRAATRFIEHPDPINDAVSAGERLPALSYDQESHIFQRFNLALK